MDWFPCHGLVSVPWTGFLGGTETSPWRSSWHSCSNTSERKEKKWPPGGNRLFSWEISNCN
eukprot:1039566-Prorocentrum_minimum.AAC.1